LQICGREFLLPLHCKCFVRFDRTCDHDFG
jgi:hypothetical protein